jgi:hypothetical protein
MFSASAQPERTLSAASGSCSYALAASVPYGADCGGRRPPRLFSAELGRTLYKVVLVGLNDHIRERAESHATRSRNTKRAAHVKE